MDLVKEKCPLAMVYFYCPCSHLGKHRHLSRRFQLKFGEPQDFECLAIVIPTSLGSFRIIKIFEAITSSLKYITHIATSILGNLIFHSPHPTYLIINSRASTCVSSTHSFSFAVSYF